MTGLFFFFPDVADDANRNLDLMNWWLDFVLQQNPDYWAFEHFSFSPLLLTQVSSKRQNLGFLINFRDKGGLQFSLARSKIRKWRVQEKKELIGLRTRRTCSNRAKPSISSLTASKIASSTRPESRRPWLPSLRPPKPIGMLWDWGHNSDSLIFLLMLVKDLSFFSFFFLFLLLNFTE